MKFICFLGLLLLSIKGYSIHADTVQIRQHLVQITKTKKPRNARNIETLNEVAQYIFEQFSHHGDTTYFQPYTVDGKTYKNVITKLGPKDAKTIVIGAHYDVCGYQEGADDNASGVVGLLELVRLLAKAPLNYQIEFVAYTLEEPPYFRTEHMGSYIHARALKASHVNVYGMICLEMIGYFSDQKGSQDYPLGLLSLFYGKTGDYITLVNQFSKGKFARSYTRSFLKSRQIKTKKFTGPKSLQGIDFSDHLNYWKMGYSAIMITDTAFYRNKNYHRSTDQLATLNLPKMALVINSIYQSLIQLK